MIKTCLLCSKEYKPTRTGQRFCSISCGTKSHPPGAKGAKRSLETLKRMSISHMGKSSGFYIHGKTKDKIHRRWINNQWHVRFRAASGKHTSDEWETLKAQYNWTCLACKKREPTIKLTRDHIIPLSKGGSNNIENIQPLCNMCNCRKQTKIISY